MLTLVLYYYFWYTYPYESFWQYIKIFQMFYLSFYQSNKTMFKR